MLFRSPEAHPARWAFVAALSAFAMVGVLSLMRGAVSEDALRLWAEGISTQHLAASEGAALRDWGAVGPRLLARALVFLPGASIGWLLLPAVVMGALAAALLPALGRFRGSGLLALAFVTSPFLLRAATDPALSIFGLFALALAFVFLARIERGGGFESEAGFALSVAALVLFEQGAVYLLTAFGTVLPSALRSHGGIWKRAVRSSLLFLPALAVWFWSTALGWGLAGRPPSEMGIAWLEPMHGLLSFDGPSAWSLRFSGPGLASLGAILLLLCLGTPFVFAIVAMLRNVRALRYPVTALAVLYVPAFAAYEANALLHVGDPWPWLSYASAALVLWMALEPLRPSTRRVLAAAFLLTNAVAWSAGRFWEGREQASWRASFLGPVDSFYAEAAETSAFLSRMQSVVIDDAAAFPIVALLDRKQSLVPIRWYLEGVDRGEFLPDAILVTNPETAIGLRDRLNLALPTLWEKGVPGYRLVLERPGWRVYRRAKGVVTGV